MCSNDLGNLALACLKDTSFMLKKLVLFDTCQQLENMDPSKQTQTQFLKISIHADIVTAYNLGWIQFKKTNKNQAGSDLNPTPHRIPI